MTPEQALLMRCAVAYPNQEQLAEIGRLLGSSLNWPKIISWAGKHGLLQLLYHTVQQIDGVELPELVRAELSRQFERAIRHNLFLAGELIRIIRLLEEEGITAVPFKGPVLAEKLYGSLARRVFGDLDILIHARDRERIKTLLLAAGYESRFHPDSAFQFVKIRPQIVLEVHWEAISFGSDWLRKLKNKPLPTSLSYLTPRLVETTLGGRTVATLSPEDSLLILTIHGSKHWWSRLNWLADIAALIHVYPNLDWEWIVEQTEHWRIRRLVFLGLSLAHDLLQAQLPAAVQEEIRMEPQIRKLSRLVESMFFVEQNFQTRYIKRPSYFRQIWDTRDERRMVSVDHFAIYMKLFTNLFKEQAAGRK